MVLDGRKHVNLLQRRYPDLFTDPAGIGSRRCIRLPMTTFDRSRSAASNCAREELNDMRRFAILISLVGVAVWAAGGAAQSPNPFGIPSADQPTPGASHRRRQPVRERKAGLRRGAPRSWRATASSPRAIRWRLRRASRYCARAATPSTRRLRRERCSTSRLRTTPASAEISSRWCGPRETRSCTR